MHQSQVELGTSICRNIEELREELAKQRGTICQIAEDRALRIVGAGTHPFSRWLEQEVTAALIQVAVAWLWDLRRRNMTFRLYRGAIYPS